MTYSLLFISSKCFNLSSIISEGIRLTSYRLAPSPDPSLTIKFYERTPEQQAVLGYAVDLSQAGEVGDEISSQERNTPADGTRRVPHGSIGSTTSQRAIAQGNSAQIAEALFRYSAPEEVQYLFRSSFPPPRLVLFLLLSFLFCENVGYLQNYKRGNFIVE